jgi:hypothetical protein
MLKFLKRLLFWILALIALVLVVALFLPTKFNVKRSAVISQPKDSIYNYVSLLENQEKYGVWWQADPKMEVTHSGTDGQPGFTTTWRSKNAEVGSGQQKIMALQPGQRIDLELQFFEPFESTNKSFMSTQQIDSTTTQVTWGISGEMPYPGNIMSLFIDMEKQLGTDLEKGLKNLKRILEK